MATPQPRAPRQWRQVTVVFLIMLVAGCAGTSSTSTSPVTTLNRPTYHFTLRVVANWVVYHEQEDPGTVAPYSVNIQRASVAPGPLNSSLNLQVLTSADPSVMKVIASLPTNPQYHATTLNGVRAYVSEPHVYHITPPTLAPGASTLPNATPLPDSSNTYTHTDYAIPTATLLYTAYTESVGGDGAASDLQAMMQSLTITP